MKKSLVIAIGLAFSFAKTVYGQTVEAADPYASHRFTCGTRNSDTDGYMDNQGNPHADNPDNSLGQAPFYNLLLFHNLQ